MNETISNEQVKKKRRKSIFSFIGSFVLSLVLTYLLREPTFTDSQVYTLFLLFFAAGLWVTDAIPPFAVSLFIMAYLVFALGNKYFNSSPEKIDKYVNTFSSSIIWLLLGGFFLSAAMTKTKLDETLLKLTLKISGTNPRNILIALMFTTMIGSMLMSNTATAAMIIVAIMPLLNTLGKSNLSKGLLLGISIAATIGGIGTIIGSPPNAMAVGLLERNNVHVDFLEWMLYGMPICIVLTAIGCWVLIKLYIKNAEPVSFTFLDKNTKDVDNESNIQRNVVLVVILITILLWLTSSLHGISVSAVSAIPIVILTLTGVLSGKDIRELPWDTLFLISGGLSLGLALESTGIMNHFANKIKTLNASDTVYIFILSYLTSIFANIISSVAACAVLIPLGMAVIPGSEKQLALSIGISSSMALFLTVSNPPNAIVYNTGFLELKDFRLGGLLVGLLGPLLAVLWVALFN